MTYAYLDAGGHVLGAAITAISLVDAQAKLPTVVERIDNAPSGVTAKATGGKIYYHQKTSGDGSDISHYVQIEYLVDYKQLRYEQIDKKDEDLINQGFTHGGNVFSLSSNAQKTWLMLHQMRTLLTYPLEKSVLDDSLPPYSIANQTELETMAATILGTVSGVIGNGSTLKTSIRASTSKAAIDAIVDTR